MFVEWREKTESRNACSWKLKSSAQGANAVVADPNDDDLCMVNDTGRLHVVGTVHREQLVSDQSEKEHA